MRTRHSNNMNISRDARPGTPSPFGVTDPFTDLSHWAAPFRPLTPRDESVRQIDPSEGISEALKDRRPTRSGLPGSGDLLREIGRGYTMTQSNPNLYIYNLNIASAR